MKKLFLVFTIQHEGDTSSLVTIVKINEGMKATLGSMRAVIGNPVAQIRTKFLDCSEDAVQFNAPIENGVVKIPHTVNDSYSNKLVTIS